MQERFKSISLSGEKIKSLSEEQRRQLFETLGSLGLMPEDYAALHNVRRRKRNFLARAYPSTEEMPDEDIDRLAGVLPQAVRRALEPLPPQQSEDTLVRLGRLERYFAGEGIRDIAHSERLSLQSARNSNVILSGRVARLLPLEELLEEARRPEE